jgi:tetratricopeptide (TPR) repeat protein
MRKNRLTLLIIALISAPFLLRGQSEKAQFDLANSLYLDNNYWLAEPLFDSYAADRPDDPLAGDAKFMAGESEYSTGQFKKALNSYNAIIERYSQTQNKYRKELYYRIAECYYQIKEYDKSTDYVNMLLKEYPQSYLTADVYLLLGENYFLTGKYSEALDTLNKIDAFTEYPHFDYVNYLKGRVCYEKGLQDAAGGRDNDFLEAIKYFDRVKNEFPDSKILGHSEFRKANAYYSMGKYPDSIAIINPLIEKEGDVKFRTLMKYFLAWNYYMEGQYKKALSIYTVITDASSTDILSAWSEFKKGLCYVALNDPDSAMAQYKPSSPGCCQNTMWTR